MASACTPPLSVDVVDLHREPLVYHEELVAGVLLQYLYRVNELERHEGRFAELSEAQTVVPVRVKSRGHTVTAEVVH